MGKKKLSRRDFLRLSALTAAGATLAGCCPSAFDPLVAPGPKGNFSTTYSLDEIVHGFKSYTPDEAYNSSIEELITKIEYTVDLYQRYLDELSSSEIQEDDLPVYFRDNVDLINFSLLCLWSEYIVKVVSSNNPNTKVNTQEHTNLNFKNDDLPPSLPNISIDLSQRYNLKSDSLSPYVVNCLSILGKLWFKQGVIESLGDEDYHKSWALESFYNAETWSATVMMGLYGSETWQNTLESAFKNDGISSLVANNPFDSLNQDFKEEQRRFAEETYEVWVNSQYMQAMLSPFAEKISSELIKEFELDYVSAASKYDDKSRISIENYLRGLFDLISVDEERSNEILADPFLGVILRDQEYTLEAASMTALIDLAVKEFMAQSREVNGQLRFGPAEVTFSEYLNYILYHQDFITNIITSSTLSGEIKQTSPFEMMVVPSGCSVPVYKDHMPDDPYNPTFEDLEHYYRDLPPAQQIPLLKQSSYFRAIATEKRYAVINMADGSALYIPEWNYDKYGKKRLNVIYTVNEESYEAEFGNNHPLLFAWLWFSHIPGIDPGKAKIKMMGPNLEANLMKNGINWKSGISVMEAMWYDTPKNINTTWKKFIIPSAEGTYSSMSKVYSYFLDGVNIFLYDLVNVLQTSPIFLQ
ncbi:twin-arginine translocation signal domain-containing protein [Candidatus Woesearchaeota archaeon]|nr:twin-arginine translocation signal domain-containing protein [Candidatus Woesearchaeota archaeon]